MHPSVPGAAWCVRGEVTMARPHRRVFPRSWQSDARLPRPCRRQSDTPLAGPLQRARGPRAGNTTRTMEDRERRLQWHPAARARRDRATAWGTTLLHTLPLIAACLLALLLGRPEIAAATLGLAMLTLGLVRTLTRPRKLAMARLREVRRSH
jgi:hypothetical protein